MELIDTKGMAAALKCSPSGIRKLRSAGRLPAPVRIGKLLRWRADEIADWLAAGAPNLDRWETMKSVSRKGAK